MKSLVIGLIMAMACAANAATLRWDASTGADGYTVYFDSFTHSVTGTEVLDIDSTLNLHPDTTYTFTVTAWNQMGESLPSNSVDYTTNTYTPPVDNLPIVVNRPATITIIVE